MYTSNIIEPWALSQLDPYLKHRPNMTALSLPTEIWVAIAKQGRFKSSAYSSLVVVSKDFFYTFTPMLYANVRIKFPSPLNFPPVYDTTSEFSMAGPRAENLLNRLKSDHVLKSYVRSCRVEHLRYTQAQKYRDQVAGYAGKYETFEDAVMNLVAALPQLAHLTLYHTLTEGKWITHFATQPSAISITLESDTTIDGEFAPASPVTISSFRTEGLLRFPMIPLLFSGSIQHLILGPISLGDISKVHQEHGSPLLASVKTLKILKLTDAGFGVLKCMPNLRELKISDFSSPSNVYASNWTSILPRLELVEGGSHFIPLLVARRSIATLRSSGRFISVFANGLGAQFGSNVPVRFLTWEHCQDPLQLVRYLITSNPNIEVLHINYIPDTVKEVSSQPNRDSIYY